MITLDVIWEVILLLASMLTNATIFTCLLLHYKQYSKAKKLIAILALILSFFIIIISLPNDSVKVSSNLSVFEIDGDPYFAYKGDKISNDFEEVIDYIDVDENVEKPYIEKIVRTRKSLFGILMFEDNSNALHILHCTSEMSRIIQSSYSK